MKKPRRLYQYVTSLTAFLAMFTSGLFYSWSSPSIPKYLSGDASFKITEDEGSLIIIMQLLAPMLSCFVGGFIIDKIGRKKTILLTAIPYFVGWLLIVFATSAIELCVAKFLAGFSDGIVFTVVPLYVGEIADADIRGFLGSGMSVVWIFGILVINVIGIYFSLIVTAIICSIIPILFLVTFCCMPESPYYLLMKNRTTDARWALVKFKGTLDVDDELTRLQNVVKAQNENSKSVLELFTRKSNRKGLAIMAILRNGQQMSGVAAISFYTLTIFQEAGDFLSPFTATVLYVSIQCIMTGVCSLIIDKTGRRPLLIISLTGSGVCLFTFSAYFYIRDCTNINTELATFVPLASLIGFVIIFNVGTQPIPMLMVGEIFPTNVKGLASCIAEVYFCIIASSFSKFFQITKDNYGIFVPFLGFAICCVINVIFVVLFVPETKGKTLEDIQKELD